MNKMSILTGYWDAILTVLLIISLLIDMYFFKCLVKEIKKKKPKIYQQFFYSEGWAVPIPYQTMWGKFILYCLNFENDDNELRKYKILFVVSGVLIILVFLVLIFL